MSQFLKNIELGFRRSLIKLLSKVVRSRRPPPQGIDFNKCKFLFVRQDRIGDVLVSTPLFKSLNDRYPGAVIDVLLSSKNHFVLANDPLVRIRWIYEKKFFSGLKMLKGIWKERYDFVIDLMDNPSATSTVFCLISRSRWNVGLEKDNAYVYDIVVPLLSRKDTHIVDRIAQLLTPFGIDPKEEDFRIRYTVPDRARQFALRVFDGYKIRPERTIGINISAGHDVRFWGVENFRSLITLVQHSYRNYAVLLLSKPSQRKSAEEIVHGFENVFLSPPTHSFDEFASLIAQCCLLITPDTSAVHLAAAFGVPAVVLYVQSNKDLRIWEPYKSRSEVLIADVDDLRVITPVDVFKASQRLLKRNPRRSRHKHSRAAVHS